MRKPILSLLFACTLLAPAFSQDVVVVRKHPLAGGSAPTFDAATFSLDTSVSHTCSGSDRLLLIAVAYTGGNARTVSTLTYNSVSLTQVAVINNANGGANNAVELWRLIAPATGSNTVALSMSGPPGFDAMCIVSYNGVHQTTPLGTAVTNSGSNSTQPTVTFSSGTNELGFDALSTLASNGDTFTPDGGQTKQTSGDDPGEIGGAVSNEVGAASSVMGWSSPTRFWAIIGVSIKPV